MRHDFTLGQVENKLISIGVSSLQVGPVFVHQESDFETYHYFFSYLAGQLAKTKMTLKGIEVTYDEQCFGTDEELSLVMALESAFPGAPIAFCTKHIKKKIL